MKLLAQSSYWVLNKHITRALNSLEASLVLSLLCDMHVMHPKKDMVFCKQSYIEKETGLSYHRIGKAIELLETKNLIYRERETQTLQPKMLYKVLKDNVMELYTSKDLTSIGGKSKGHINNIPKKEYIVEEEYNVNVSNVELWDKLMNE